MTDNISYKESLRWQESSPLLASLLNWDWFFTTRNAQTIVRNVGRNRARLFYGILGIIIIGMAVFLCGNTESHRRIICF